MADAAVDKPWAGRLVMWRGGSIWLGQVASATDIHVHHTIQVTLSLEGSVPQFRTALGEWVDYQASIIAAHQPHAFQASGNLIALIFAEPESRAGRALRARYPDGIARLDADNLRQPMQALAAAYRQGQADEALADIARGVIGQLAQLAPAPPRTLDQRIERAIAAMRERLGDAVAMADIAHAVHLSPERFRHLFLQETGVRFRPYLLWLRLEVALGAYAAGRNLTEASHAGGFADSAHLSRTFRRMYGVPAIDVRHHGAN